MTIFLSGGCKNGKSTLAESCVCALAPPARRWYVATMLPCDEEDRARIRRHVAARAGKGFRTLERSREIAALCGEIPAGDAFLLDSVTALLSNEMFPPEGFDPRAGERVAAALSALARERRDAVFVSDFLFAGAGGYDAMTERYRRALAACDAALAAACDTVAEVCVGQVYCYKGALPV